MSLLSMIQQSLSRRFTTPQPRKEGRSLSPNTIYRLRRRRTITYGIIIVILVLIASYALHVSRRESQDVQDVNRPSVKSEQDIPEVHATSTIDVVSLVESAPYETPTHAKSLEQQLASDPVPDARRHSPHVHIPVNTNLGFDEWPRFDAAFKRVLSSLPDELHIRELLRPFEGTGEEKLRDIGLRARAFKVFFETWEALHLVWNGDVPYVRQDVVQYLRNHHEKEKLSSTGLAQASSGYDSYRYFIQQLSQLLFPWTAPYFPDHMSLHAHFHGGGRGIVLTAGDGQAPYLLASIPSFRRLGCTLPVEVMYLGDTDLSEDYRAELEALDGVITRDLSRMISDEGWKLAGWAAKPFAILHSSFREVIFIDADSLFFVNPELLFDDPLYLETGALFFKDRLIMPESKKLWLQQILPKPVSKQVMQSRLWRGESAHMQESGTIIVDKWKHFVALLMVTRMNGPDRDGKEDEGIIGVYDMVYGDKETFWVGWELVGDRDYAFHEGDAATMGVVKEKSAEKSSETTGDNDEESSEEGDDNDGESSEKSDDDGEESPEKSDDSGEHDVEATASEVSEETEESDDEVPAGKFTICAPQLLHLDRDGRPLWFNGWVLNDKFASPKKKEFSRFEAYMKEPREVTEPGAWQLKDDNLCCLTSDETFTFTEDEKDVLEMIVGLAKAADVHGRS